MAKVTDETIRVFTGPEWLMQMFNGHQNEEGTARIEIVRDANGLPIIGTTVAIDPNWNMQLVVNGKPLIEWLTEIPYTYENETP